MTYSIDAHRDATVKAEWEELDPPLICPKNGKSMTNGKAQPNGGGLTSGPGMVNGMALTCQTPRPDEERRPEGFHLYSEEVTRRWEEHLPRGLGFRRDLINGFATEGKGQTKENPRRRWFLGGRKGSRKKRMEELAEGPMPGEDD
jgi:hypothetical protein